MRLARKRNEDEDSPNKLYTLVSYVPVTSFKGELHKRVGALPISHKFILLIINYAIIDCLSKLFCRTSDTES